MSGMGLFGYKPFVHFHGTGLFFEAKLGNKRCDGGSGFKFSGLGIDDNSHA